MSQTIAQQQGACHSAMRVLKHHNIRDKLSPKLLHGLIDMRSITPGARPVAHTSFRWRTCTVLHGSLPTVVANIWPKQHRCALCCPVRWLRHRQLDAMLTRFGCP